MANVKAATQTNGNTKAIGWLKLLMPPVIAATGAAFGGYLAIEIQLVSLSAEWRSLRRDFDASQKRLDHAGAAMFIRTAEEKLRELERRIRAHADLGVDGVPHPASWRNAIRDLERRVEALEAK